VIIMNTYTVIEAQNMNSTREGKQITTKDLVSAKRAASKAQCFHGTILKIEQNGRLVAYKDANGWTNV
jgi:hypothetical protein